MNQGGSAWRPSPSDNNCVVCKCDLVQTYGVKCFEITYEPHHPQSLRDNPMCMRACVCVCVQGPVAVIWVCNLVGTKGEGLPRWLARTIKNLPAMQRRAFWLSLLDYYITLLGEWCQIQIWAIYSVNLKVSIETFIDNVMSLMFHFCISESEMLYAFVSTNARTHLTLCLPQGKEVLPSAASYQYLYKSIPPAFHTRKAN